MARTPFRAARVYLRRPAVFHGPALDTGFYAYYRLGRSDKPADARREPRGRTNKTDGRKGEELKTHYEPSHSLFGIVWQIASTTGWSVHYILWGVNYQTIALMLADAPHYTTRQAGKRRMTTEAIFQSKIKDATRRN